MAGNNPKLISDLAQIPSDLLNPSVRIELETETESYRGTIADLFEAMGDQFIDGDTLRGLLGSKMNIGGAVEDSTKFNGKTETEWLQLIRETATGSASDVGGLTPANIATKDEVAQVAADLEHLASILQSLFDSLNGSNP